MPTQISVSGADRYPESGGVSARAALEVAREALCAETLRGAGGHAALERFTARVDDLVQQLYADAAPAEPAPAVYALGGYGRRHLCLHSDIDLLVLFPGTIARRRRSFFAHFCIRSGIWAWSSGTRCGS